MIDLAALIIVSAIPGWPIYYFRRGETMIKARSCSIEAAESGDAPMDGIE
jgi:hypothetical protein